MKKEIIRIEPAEAKLRIDVGKAVVLDVVSPASWSHMYWMCM